MSTRTYQRKPIYVLIIPQFQDIFHSFYAGEVTKGVNLAASRLNIDILIHIVDRNDHSLWLDPSLLDRQSVDGILFADIDRDLDVVKQAIRSGMPCLVLNNILTEPINYIAINNKKAAVGVVEYLLDLGHERIATVVGDLTTQAGQARLEGYQEALKKHEIPMSKNYVKHGGFLRTPARKAAEELLDLKKRPTAIFAASDVMALEIFSVAKERKIRVPHDLSIVGFDDNPISMTSSVRLSTVRQPLVEMARIGMERLYQISRGKAKLPVKEILEAKLIIGQSTIGLDH